MKHKSTLTGPPKKAKSVKKLGRPRKYKPEDIYSLAMDYFEECKTDVKRVDKEGNKIYRPPTLSGFCRFLEVDKTYMTSMMREDPTGEYTRVYGFVKNAIENGIEEGMLVGLLNPQSGIFNLKNNFGQADKIETKNDNDNKIIITFKD